MPQLSGFGHIILAYLQYFVQVARPEIEWYVRHHIGNIAGLGSIDSLPVTHQEVQELRIIYDLEA